MITNIEKTSIHLARQKDMIEVEEINVKADHIHTVLSVPPKYSISLVTGNTVLDGSGIFIVLKRGVAGN